MMAHFRTAAFFGIPAFMLLFLGSSYLVVTTEAFTTVPTKRGSVVNINGNINIHRKNSQQQLQMSVPNSLDVLTSGLVSIFRLPFGITVSSPNTNNENAKTKITKLYDIENSKNCRLVRERITELDLVIDRVIPVATGSKNAASMPGREAPVLVAESSDNEEPVTIEGTEAILSFLDESFPSNAIQESVEEDVVAIAKEKLLLAGLYLSSWMRRGRGEAVSPSAAASNNNNNNLQPLTLYSYEGNQFCRLVREVLTELDIVYELRSAGKESPRRSELAGITGGSSQCPYLIDPNTGVSMSESADIVEYLYKTYGTYTPPSELLGWVSTNVMSLAKPVFGVLAPLQAGGNDADGAYERKLQKTIADIKAETSAAPLVVYTYELSPFSSETILLLDRLGVEYQEISLGKEWLPGLIDDTNGAIKRAAFLEMTGQSSLPHVFVDGKAIGGLYSGNPGLLSLLEQGEFPTGSANTIPSSSIGGGFDTTDAFQ